MGCHWGSLEREVFILRGNLQKGVQEDGLDAGQDVDPRPVVVVVNVQGGAVQALDGVAVVLGRRGREGAVGQRARRGEDALDQEPRLLGRRTPAQVGDEAGVQPAAGGAGAVEEAQQQQLLLVGLGRRRRHERRVQPRLGGLVRVLHGAEVGGQGSVDHF